MQIRLEQMGPAAFAVIGENCANDFGIAVTISQSFFLGLHGRHSLAKGPETN
jgi:hypothetical protein